MADTRNELSVTVAADLARRALDNVAREYPNHPQYLLTSDTDALPPRVVHPCFFGAFDWHSAVHNHWLLVRLLNAAPRLELRAEIEAALARSFDPAKTRVEAAYLERHPAFERPYGLAWLALLAAEVRSSTSAAAGAWNAALQPLADASRANVVRWLGQLRYPVRSGTHNQTAFALTLLHDAAAAVADDPLLELLRAAALRLYRADVDAPLGFEPSGEDFLSPCWMEADLMRRVLVPHDFAEWLARFLPRLPTRDDAAWLPCAEVADEADGKAVHLHGLNLSRAWNLAKAAAALPDGDARRAALLAAADRHRIAGLAATLATRHYAGNHWLPSFAVYLLTQRGAVAASSS
ncbi:MAG TPA: DUF2891 family protein [Gammaproteobacteria bacterium]|nr:DUF2891 family protein [Gammaproteobacteria bacterium]